jgi:BolA protein
VNYGIEPVKNKKMKRLTAEAAWLTCCCMPIADTIRQKLTATFAPAELVVEDDSARHAGHSGAAPGGETHFNVKVVSAAFAGLSRVERQRRVYAALNAELNGPVHALSLVTQTPDEAARA